MRLIKAAVTGFRSIATTLDFYPHRELTCLIGANEHGKSNILDALDMMDGGDFETYDRHVYSKSEDHPQLIFTLEFSGQERSDFVNAVTEEIALREGAPENEERQKALGILYDTLAWLRNKDSNTLSIGVYSDNSRILLVKPARYSLTGDRPLKMWLESAVPSVRLFEPSSELEDSASLAELQAKRNLPFVGLLKLAGAWDELSTLFAGDNTAHRHLQHAGRRLTRRVRRIWSQGSEHIFRFDQTGDRLHVSIEDPVTFDKPSRRSLGFRSFFSFYLSLYAETDEIDPEGFVLLFDEPGIHLHPKGQKDLLRELRKLSAKNQIVYTTHSPFMIDRNDPAATILVKKGFRAGSKGTRLIAKSYGDNWSAVTEALGISPSDAFFPADRILLVEGRSDRLYVMRYMTLCQRHTKADLNFFSVVDAEERDQVEDYVRMVLAHGRTLVVLADADQGGDDLARRVKQIASRRKGHVEFLDLRTLAELDKDVSIEDMLDLDNWLGAVNEYVTKILRQKIVVTREKLVGRASNKTLGRATAQYLVELGVISEAGKFSKTTVADLYCRRALDVPSEDSTMTRLCEAVTRSLALVQ